MRLRFTEEGDLAALAEMTADRFGLPLTAEEWCWKYRQLPGEALSAVAVDDTGRVLAHAGALRLPARWQGRSVGAWQLIDFAGRPGGRGLRPALVDLGRWLLDDLPRDGDLPWIFGFPSERHFRLGQRTFGYRPLARLPVFAGELDRGARAAAPCASVRLEISDHCGAAAAAAWRACAVSGVERSAVFLNWRYHARPQRYYRFYRLLAPAAEGLAVFAFVGREAAAAELWLPDGLDARAALTAMAADLAAAGIERWRFWPLAGGAGEALWSTLGLRPAGEAFVGYRGRGGAEVAPSLQADFTYSMGDHDLT